jgi:hypothetical protein
MHRLVLRVGLSLALLACLDVSSPQDQIVGSWTLTSVNSSLLPATIEETDSTKLEVVSWTFAFSTEGTFAMKRVTRTTTAGAAALQTENKSGIYSVAGGSVTMTQTGTGSIDTATLIGARMTIEEFALASPSGFWVYTFRKE